MRVPRPGRAIAGWRQGWIVRYQVPSGQRRKIALGAVIGKPLAEARREAVQIDHGAKDGHDPHAEREI